MSATQCLYQPLAGFLAKKSLEDHKQILFVCSQHSQYQKNRSWRTLLPHFWELPLICWIWSWVWQILDLNFWIPCCVLRSLDEPFLGFWTKKDRFICNMPTDMFNNPGKQCQRHWVSFYFDTCLTFITAYLTTCSCCNGFLAKNLWDMWWV